MGAPGEPLSRAAGTAVVRTPPRPGVGGGPRGADLASPPAHAAASAALSPLGPETPLSAGELHSCLGLEMLWPWRFGIFARGEEQMVQKVADLLVMKRKARETRSHRKG